MPIVRNFTVLPALPDSLKGLEAIARNMFWSWNHDFVELFKRIDSNLWTACGHNPISFLGNVSQERLEAVAENQGFLCQLKQAVEKLNSYLNGTTWFEKVSAKHSKPLIAYFSAEFGIHECLPIYAGGLGILAGDHLKSASDLGVPIVGIGLLYQKGYFRQNLNIDGWQQELYVENDFYNMPLELVRKDNGRPLKISVEYPGRSVSAHIWRVSIGRVPLFLLDTKIPENSSVDRMITASLYGGDREVRIRQEIMLGIGGLRALSAMNIPPTVCHMNEGHAAFATLERIRQLRNEKNMTFDEAAEATSSANIFTMHTCVKAGLDEFSVELMDKYFGGYFPTLGINRKRFLTLGRILPDDDHEPFKMAVLGLNLSSYTNGVSKLHGRISRELFSSLWPGLPVDEVPIKHITNGVHIKTWTSDEMSSLYETYLGPNWADETHENSLWKNTEQIPDEQLWRAHQRCKEQLVVFARNRLKNQMRRRGTYDNELNQAEEILDPQALTVGFARRFASYKRANLLLKDPNRLLKLLTDTEHPVQIIFAGKAHPKDTEGKEIIRQIINFANQYNLRRQIVFLEDYDINVARAMVCGVDVWLSSPRRPMEASSTSGMKAAINGGLNMSTLDGWWCEGYSPDVGWVIGAGESYNDAEYQDLVESQAIYNILEGEVVPLFYTRSADNIPRTWIRKMKNSIRLIAPVFNTHRMLAEYTRRCYNPAAARWRYLTAEAMSRARALSMWKSNMKTAWPEFAIKDVQVQLNNGQSAEELNLNQHQLKLGSELKIKALVKLGKTSPDDVSVEVYHGPLDSRGNITESSTVRMAHKETNGQNGEYWFVARIPCRKPGRQGLTVRLLPNNSDLANPYDLGLVLWETTSTKQVQ